MQWSTVFLFVLCLNAGAAGYSQGISLSLTNAPLKKAFTEITRQAGAQFLFTEQLLKDSKPVSVSLFNVTVGEALDACLHNQPLGWEMINGTIVISKKIIPLLKSERDTLRPVRGIIRGNGTPIGGASVMIAGTQKGTFTRDDGSFTIQVSSAENILLVTSVGYEGQEITIGKRSFIDISLSSMVNKLDEAVVIGYGTTTKRLNTGSVGRITSEDISKQPVSNPLQALQGRITGLSITQNTGLPGGDFKIQLRGQNSIRSTGNDLLFIVDGVPFPSTSLHGNLESANGAISPLSSINPLDIQSIEVLKDADATAIYGSRGANGVVLITTKKGLTGNYLLLVNFYTGTGKIARRMPLMDTKQYLAMRREAFNNDGWTPDPTYDPDLTVWDSAKSTDWQKQLIGGNAHISNANINYSGGSENTQFYLGGNYYRETTVLPGDFKDEKASLLMNVNHHAFDNKLDLSISVNFLKDNSDLFKRDITWNAMILPPNTPDLVDKKNKKVLWPDGIYNNPYPLLFQTNRLTSTNLTGNGSIKYRFARNFECSASLGYTNMNLDEQSKVPLASLNTVQVPTDRGSATFSHSQVETWIAEPQVKWQQQFGKHRLSILTGLTFQETKRTGRTLLATGYTSDDALENIQAAAAVSISGNIQSTYRYSSSYSRVTYTGNERYLLNLTARTDASSRFGSGKRIGNFGAIGAGWIFTKENWIASHLQALNYGKIRGSYGITGNDQIGDYGYLDSWTSNGITYQGTVGLNPYNLKNDQYSWETNKKLEFALEAGFFREKLTTTIAWYKNRSSNQLIGYTLPGTTGFSFIQDNFPATVQNTGWELEADMELIHSDKWVISAGLNFTLPKNKLVSFPGLLSSVYANSYEIGRSLYIKNLFHFTGLNNQTGLYEFLDVDKDGNISYPNDLQFYKTIEQKYFGAFNTKIKFRQFQLDVLVQFVKQTGLNYLTGFDAPGTFGNQPILVMNRWKQAGDQTTVERFTQDYGSAAYDAFYLLGSRSDAAISDASYIRFKNIHLSYSLPEKILNKIGMKQCQLYCQAQNLFTFTNYAGMDPENTNINRLPPLKVITAGIQIQL